MFHHFQHSSTTPFSYSSYNTTQNLTRYVFDYSKADYLGLNQYISTWDLTSYYNITDVNNAWSILKQLIINGMELFIPKIKLKTTQFPKWLLLQFVTTLNVSALFVENYAIILHCLLYNASFI